MPPRGLSERRLRSRDSHCSPKASRGTGRRDQIDEPDILTRFHTRFRNSAGVEVAATWFDDNPAAWKVSTVPLRQFTTEQEAIQFFQFYCDTETGLQITRRVPVDELIGQLRKDRLKSQDLQRQTRSLLGEIGEIVTTQRDHIKRIYKTETKIRDTARNQPHSGLG